MPATVSTATLTKAPATAPPPKEQQDVAKSGKEDFFWTYTEEPHRTRRQAIIKAHPEVSLTSLFVRLKPMLSHCRF
jgi:sphingolipid delta-4 desaturase